MAVTSGKTTTQSGSTTNNTQSRGGPGGGVLSAPVRTAPSSGAPTTRAPAASAAAAKASASKSTASKPQTTVSRSVPGSSAAAAKATALGRAAQAAQQNVRSGGTASQWGGRAYTPGQIYKNPARSSSALNSVLNNTRLAGMNTRQTVDAVARNMGLMNPLGRAGMIGTFDHESAGLNPNALGDKNTAYGLGQWRFDRRTALGNYAGRMGQPIGNPGLQTAFAISEMGRAYPRTLSGLQNAQNIAQAVSAMNDYERPRGWAPGGAPSNVAGWKDRVARSYTALNGFGTEQSPVNRVATANPIGSATAAEESVRRAFVDNNLGVLATDPAINRGLTSALGRGMWDTRIEDATRMAQGLPAQGAFGEVSPATALAGFRTLNQQKSIPGKFTNIKDPARGFHTWGMAVDVTPERLAGETQKEYDNRVGEVNRTIASNIDDPSVTWGGDWRNVDPAHFQYGSGRVSRAVGQLGSPVTQAGVRPSGAPAPVQLASADIRSIPRPRPRPVQTAIPRPVPRPPSQNMQRPVGGMSFTPGLPAPMERLSNVETYIDPNTGISRNPYDAPRPGQYSGMDSFTPPDRTAALSRAAYEANRGGQYSGFGDFTPPDRTAGLSQNPFGGVRPASYAGYGAASPLGNMPAPERPRLAAGTYTAPYDVPPRMAAGTYTAPYDRAKQIYDRVAQEQGPVPQIDVRGPYPGASPAGTYTAPYDIPRMSPFGNMGLEPHKHPVPPNPQQYRNEPPPAAPNQGTPASQTAETVPSLWENPGAWIQNKTGVDPANVKRVATDTVQQLSEGQKKVAKIQSMPGGNLLLRLAAGLGGGGGTSTPAQDGIATPDRDPRNGFASYFSVPQTADAEVSQSELLALLESMKAKGATPEEIAYVQSLVQSA